LHPGFLDSRGLVACWRESLLALKVLKGLTRGYIHHPQLLRFRTSNDPVGTIAAYLRCIADEARQRNYHFDELKIPARPSSNIARPMPGLTVTTGQLQYEWSLLQFKLQTRNPDWLQHIEKMQLFVSKEFINDMPIQAPQPGQPTHGKGLPVLLQKGFLQPHPLFQVVPGDIADWERVRLDIN